MNKKKRTKKKSQQTRKKTSVKTTSSDAVNGLRWPVERDVLYRPARLGYIKAQKDHKKSGYPHRECVFCQSIANAKSKGPAFENLILYTSDKAMVVMNKFPYNLGHLMVLPTQHTGDILSLSSEEWAEMNFLVRKCVSIIKKTFDVEEFNIGMNLGRMAGAGIPEHLHIHVLPRWLGDTNFFPLIAGSKALPGDLESIYRLLRPLFGEHV